MRCLVEGLLFIDTRTHKHNCVHATQRPPTNTPPCDMCPSPQ